MKRAVILLLIAAVIAVPLSACNTRSEPISPDDITTGDPETAEEPPEEAKFQWTVDKPENHGMDSDVLWELHRALIDVSNFHSLVIVKDGVIVDEFYGKGYDVNSVFRLASVSKSFMGAVVGLALDEGYIEDIDDSIAKYLPQAAGTDKEAITVRHLLNHTSGIEWYEWGGGNSFRQLQLAENRVDHVLAQRMLHTPGTIFAYTTGGPHLLAAIVQQATGQSVYDYAKPRLFDPLDMDSVTWSEDAQGITDGGNGIAMTARDAAKFGQLFLDGGAWQGEQIIPAHWVEQSTTYQSSGAYDGTGTYGFQWWIRPFGAQGYDAYFAMGHGGQFIIVVPQLQMVTVITSRYDSTYAPWPFFIDYVLEAIK